MKKYRITYDVVETATGKRVRPVSVFGHYTVEITASDETFAFLGSRHMLKNYVSPLRYQHRPFHFECDVLKGIREVTS